jgi:hypothetical protein
MALPTLNKTWLFSPNNVDAVGTPFTGYGTLMYAWKVALTTLGSNPWTVVLSSDGSTNVGPADYWLNATDANVHGNGVTHSWIVLRQAALGGGSGLEICVDLRKNGGGAETIMEVYVSTSAGFTGGTLANRPTATDEVHTADGAGRHNWTDAIDLTVNPAKLHVAMSDDGTVTRWWIYVNGYCPCFYSIEEPKDAVSGWTDAWFCVACVDWYASTNFRPTYAYLNDINTNTAARVNAAKVKMYLTSEGFISSMCGQTQTYVNDLDGSAWPFFPIGLFCTTGGARGRHGMLTDLWWGSTTRVDGDHYPADLTRQFAQVGDLVVPWVGDGTIMQTT